MANVTLYAAPALAAVNGRVLQDQCSVDVRILPQRGRCEPKSLARITIVSMVRLGNAEWQPCPGEVIVAQIFFNGQTLTIDRAHIMELGVEHQFRESESSTVETKYKNRVTGKRRSAFDSRTLIAHQVIVLEGQTSGWQ